MALTDTREVFNTMSNVFNSSAAQGLDAVFQFDITGEGGGEWHVTVKDGVCEVNEGTHQNASVTMTMSAETWVAMVNKEVNGMQAFMSGKLKISGDIMLAQRFPEMFSF
jgi:putative sterol carrier protein